MIPAVLAALAGLLVLLGGCGSSKPAATAGARTSGIDSSTLPISISLSPSGSSSTSVTSAPTPDGAVAAYYNALSRHQFSVSDSYLAPATRPAQDTNIDSPNNNLASLTDFEIKGSQAVGATALPGLPAGVSPSAYDAFALVTVEYDAIFNRVITADNGAQIQFLYVGRLTSGNQWQILSIGSGP